MLEISAEAQLHVSVGCSHYFCKHSSFAKITWSLIASKSNCFTVHCCV